VYRGKKKLFKHRLAPLTEDVDNIFRYNWPGIASADQSSILSTHPETASFDEPHFVIYNSGMKTRKIPWHNLRTIGTNLFTISALEAPNFLLELQSIYTYRL